MNRISTGNLIMLCMSAFLVFGSVGCKNQQKIAEQQAIQAKAENTARAKAILLSILNDDGKMTTAEKERKLNQAISIGSDDPEVLDLIAQVREQIERERESQRLANQKKVKAPEEASMQKQLGDLFANVAAAGSRDNANQLIDEGLELFSSQDALVLIIISKSGDLKDYDEPTTIIKYLNYLKDQKNDPNKIYNLVMDSSGKVKELELIKK